MAIHLGFSIAVAALLVTLHGALAVLGPIPIGIVMDRVGERTSMVVGAVLSVLGSAAALALLAEGPSHSSRMALLAVLVVDGIAMEVWDMGRHTYLSAELPAHMRGRAMNIFGGMMRLGRVVGPALGAGALALFGFPGVYWLRIVLMVVAAVMVIRFMVPTLRTEPALSLHTPTPTRGLYPHVVRAMVLVAGGATALIVCRVNTSVLVPLVGNQIGLSAATISLVFAAVSVMEIVLFLPAGILLDRWGRGVCGALCCLGMGAGFLLVPLATRAAGSSDGGLFGWSALAWYAVASQVIALGNVLGSGIIKTLGVDLAPSHRRSAHLGLYNSLAGVGQLGGPVVVAGMTAVLSLTAAAVVTGGIGLVGAVWMWIVLPRFTPGWHGHQPAFDPDLVPVRP